MREIERLLTLMRSVPFPVVDEAAARARGDRAALDYARAVERWQGEAARAMAEVEEQPAERASAFERILLAADMRGRPANANVVSI